MELLQLRAESPRSLPHMLNRGHPRGFAAQRHQPRHRLETPLDRAAFGRHIGSRAVREFLECGQPAWFACGHVHEAAGTLTRLGATQAVNAGKGGYLIDLPAGGAESGR
ncbi:MAG: hypothetical protein ACUVS7_13230 [Bryobacteraceae bacterium]